MRFLRHPFSEDELTAYVDGQIDTAAGQRLETHITSCQACASFVAEARQLKTLLGGVQQETTDLQFFWPGAGAAAARSQPTSRRVPAALALAGVAALLLVGAASAIVLSSRGGSSPGNITAQRASPVPETPLPEAVAPQPSPGVPPPIAAPSLAPQQPTARPAPTQPPAPTPAPQILTLPQQAQPTPPRQPAPATQPAFAPPLPSPVPSTQPPVVTPSGGPQAALSAPSTSTSGTISVTPSGNLQVGKTVSICFTASRAVQTRILNQPSGQAAQVLSTAPATDQSHCYSNLQVTPPLGTETFTLQYLDGSNWVELARTSITVVR